ncbi:MAG: WYL domain-containing protein [Lachnospiraceae bacterium]|nr:WYL domain-containing protein [Lachnospiraceae bacterium]
MENGTKLRILYLYQHLLQNTDSEHSESTVELTKMLADKHGIKVSRNTISDDLAMLHNCNLQIEVIHSTQNKYYYDGQLFSVPELKVLIDAISSSKFITKHKSEELINKLLTLLPRQSAVRMRRHIYTADRVKSDNERGYYIVDAINDAIEAKRKISFRYTDYDVHKNRVLTNDGNPYTVSPYTLLWDGEYYYMIGFYDERQTTRTFRLDRIEKQPEILHAPAVPKPENFSIAERSRSVFRMYDTEEPVEVTLLCDASVMRYFIDYFGPDVDTEPVDEDHFRAKIFVCPSPTFFGWVFGFGGSIRIIGPDPVVKEYKEMAGEILDETKSNTAL